MAEGQRLVILVDGLRVAPGEVKSEGDVGVHLWVGGVDGQARLIPAQGLVQEPQFTQHRGVVAQDLQGNRYGRAKCKVEYKLYVSIVKV